MSSVSKAGNLSGLGQWAWSASTTNSSFNDTQVMAVPEGCVVLQFSDLVPWDNPDNLVSQKVVQIVDKIVAVGFLNVLYLISAPSNILNMMVFTKQGLKERIDLCLFFQSLADLLYMTENFLLYADKTYIEIVGTARQGPLSRFILGNYLLGFQGFNAASGFMTMVIATERCFCVLSPLRAQRILQTRTMLVIILSAFVVIVGVFFLVATRWNITCVYDPRTNASSLEIFPSQFYLLHKRWIDALDAYLYGIILPGTCTFVVSISTVITVIRLKKMTSWREKTSSVVTSVRDMALNRMLIGISILFVVCTLPPVIARICILFVPDFSLGGRYHNAFTLVFDIVGLFGFVNSSFNFFIYYSLGTKFNETLTCLCSRTVREKTKTGPTDGTFERDKHRITRRK